MPAINSIGKSKTNRWRQSGKAADTQMMKLLTHLKWRREKSLEKQAKRREIERTKEIRNYYIALYLISETNRFFFSLRVCEKRNDRSFIGVLLCRIKS